MRTTTRQLVLCGAVLVGGAAAATSAISLYGIAVKCGIPEGWAAANPIALDAGAAVAALAWITERGEVRDWGRGIAIGALTASLAENGLDHALASGLLPVNLVLILVVSGCIPAMLFGVVHLAALMARTPRTTTVKPRVERTPRKSSVGTATSPPVVPTETPQRDVPRKPPKVALAGVVDLGKSTRGGSRREQIRDYMRTYPDQRPAEVIRGMAEQGIKVPMKEAAEVYRRMQQAVSA